MNRPKIKQSSVLREVMVLMRWDRPIGVVLLMFPAFCGLALAGGAMPEAHLYGVLALGAFLTRSAGCVINDLWDAPFDRHVTRTKSRPLAQQSVSVACAIIVAVILLLLALILTLTLPVRSIIIAVCLLPLIIMYPLAKRVTSYPQIVLGVVFNGGVLVGWSLVRGDLPAAVWCLYGGCVLLTINYDTLYAMMDRHDDKRLQLGSLAVAVTNRRTMLTASLACACLLWSAAIMMQGGESFVIMVMTMAILFFHGTRLAALTEQTRAPSDYGDAFRAHSLLLFLLWSLIVLSMGVL